MGNEMHRATATGATARSATVSGGMVRGGTASVGTARVGTARGGTARSATSQGATVRGTSAQRGAALLVVVGAVLVGCSLRVSTGPLATVPPAASTLPPATVPTLALPTVPPTAGPVYDEPEVALSPDGPWRRVSSAPGIDTPGLFYELMPKLYVYLPTEEDLDRGITWTLGTDDVPIIEAYLQARLVYFRSLSVNPIDLDDVGWSQWYADGGASYREWLEGKRRRGEYGDLADGVVLRPVVAGDERTDTTALVMDCMLDGGVFLTSDGTLAEGSSWGVAPIGFGMRLRVVDGRWLANQTGPAEQACIGW